MVDYSELSLEELIEELQTSELNLEDSEHERVFLGKQQGQHIKATDFERIDRDIEKFGKRVEQIKGLIAAKNSNG